MSYDASVGGRMQPEVTPTPRAAGGRRRSLADLQSPRWFAVGAVLVGWLLRFWVRRYRVLGADWAPVTGGTFVIANHTSAMDPFLLGYPLRRLHPLGPGKAELYRNPAFGYVLRKLGIFPLRQGVADANAVRAMVELYRTGRTVLVYPEGTRSPDGELQAFVPDFARLVIKLRARIVPAGIVGARDVLPIGSFIPRPNVPVVVAYGEPFELSAFYGRGLTSRDTDEATAVLRDRVAEMVALARTERDRMDRTAP